MHILYKKLHPDARVPTYAHIGDAGADVYACENITIAGGARALVSTGIAVAIPVGYVGLLWDKSGVATGYGVKTLGGVIDAGYRGEIKVGLHNLGVADFEIKKGQKIAQLLLQHIAHAEFTEVVDFEPTSRGEAGFGSTGV